MSKASTKRLRDQIKDPNSWVDEGDIVSKGHKLPRGD